MLKQLVVKSLCMRTYPWSEKAVWADTHTQLALSPFSKHWNPNLNACTLLLEACLTFRESCFPLAFHGALAPPEPPACHVMSCHDMSCHFMSGHVMTWHGMAGRVMSCHIMSCHVMSCPVMSCHVMSCHVMSCHVLSCHVVSCHGKTWHGMSYHVMERNVRQCYVHPRWAVLPV